MTKKQRRLVFVQGEANSSFWDLHWEQRKSSNLYPERVPLFHHAVVVTQRFLDRGAWVLEGGAGLAQNSWFLHLSGYNVVALDYAVNTISFLQKTIPEINPLQGDVRQLGFAANCFDGYWSFGVIEHFYNGFDAIVEEAYRVLTRDGYFL